MKRLKPLLTLLSGLGLLALVQSAISLERLVHLCYHYQGSVYNLASQQGKNFNLRILFNNKSIILRPTQGAQCDSFITRQSLAKINLSCDWHHSSNTQNKSAEPRTCSVSGNPNLKLIDPSKTNQLAEHIKHHVCIIASVQKGSRGCNAANSHCIRIDTNDQSPANRPLFFELQVLHGRTKADCRAAANSNIS